MIVLIQQKQDKTNKNWVSYSIMWIQDKYSFLRKKKQDIINIFSLYLFKTLIIVCRTNIGLTMTKIYVKLVQKPLKDNDKRQECTKPASIFSLLFFSWTNPYTHWFN
jgi:hypothetical protein